MASKVNGSHTEQVFDSGSSTSVRNFSTTMKTKYIVALIVLPIIISIIIITSICLLSKTEKNLSVDTITREYSFPDKKVFYDHFSFENGRFVYLVCDKEIYYKCKLYQEIYPFKSITRSCDVSLVVDGMVHNDTFVFVESFGENRTILMWEDSKKKEGSGTNVRISIVHLNGCRKTADLVLKDSRPKFDDHSDLILRQLKLHLKLVKYNDTFDIFFKDSKRCDDKECKLSISDEGKAIGALQGFVNNVDKETDVIESIASHSPAKGYVFSRFYTKGTELTLVRPDGPYILYTVTIFIKPMKILQLNHLLVFRIDQTFGIIWIPLRAFNSK